jgi:hypothetical protein
MLMSIRAAILRLGGLMLPVMLGCTAANAAEPPSTIIIFDGSGSLWGRIAGDKDSKYGRRSA